MTLRRVAEVLAPIARVEPAPNYGVTLREIGLSEHDFVEKPCELTPGEVALACLTKAHRLAKGWCLMWPGTRGDASKGWLREEIERACRPEFLEGFAGMFASSSGAVVLVDGLECGGFSVSVAPDQPVLPSAASSSRPPAPLPAPATGGDAIAVAQSLLKRLVSYRTFAWKWDTESARRQILGIGATRSPDHGASERYTLGDGAAVELADDDGRVRWISFVLTEWTNPHLLDEGDFAHLQDNCERLFAAAVGSARALLGQPSFAGASGETGFPADQWAEYAALWPQPSGRILLETKHDDRELPLQLCLVFAP